MRVVLVVVIATLLISAAVAQMSEEIPGSTAPSSETPDEVKNSEDNSEGAAQKLKIYGKPQPRRDPQDVVIGRTAPFKRTPQTIDQHNQAVQKELKP